MLVRFMRRRNRVLHQHDDEHDSLSQKAREIQGLVDFLNFSLDGGDETHEVTGGKKFDTLVESVALAKSLGSTQLNHTVTAQTTSGLMKWEN